MFDASQIKTPEQLMQVLASQFIEDQEELDITKLRYALYAIALSKQND